MIKKIKDKIKISSLFALIITLTFFVLTKINIISYECDVQYMNPWQLFFMCNLMLFFKGLILFLTSFVIVNLIQQKLNFKTHKRKNKMQDREL